MKILKVVLFVLLGLIIGAIAGSIIAEIFSKHGGDGGYNIENQIVWLICTVIGALAGMVMCLIILIRKKSVSTTRK